MSASSPSPVGAHPAVDGRGVRATVQRQSVIDWLAAQDGFTSAQGIHAALRTSGSRIGLATVYRHLQALTDQGRVDVIHGADGETIYRLCGDVARGRHHHHLICRDCGRTEEIEGSQVERWAAKMADDHGFTSVDHTIEIFGVCAQCAALAAEPPAGRASGAHDGE
jgi:Fur family ferric uptake transcriptional regulator